MNIEELKQNISKDTEGLLLMSETDAPAEFFQISAADKNIEAVLAELYKGDENPAVTEQDTESFARMYAVEKDWQNDIQKGYARKFASIIENLKAAGDEVKVFKVGGTGADLYILGHDKSSDKWAGIKTRIVETGD